MVDEFKPAEAAAPAEQPAEENKTEEQPEAPINALKPAAKNTKQHSSSGKLVALIIITILIALVVIGFVSKNYLTRQAMESQSMYEEICVLLKGEVALFIDGEDRSLNCVSSLFDTKDENRPCVRQSECQGACTGDTKATIYVPPDTTDENRALIPPVRCSGGIRLLPEFISEMQSEE